MRETPRVLAIVAHPDDECWCTGTLAAQVDAGLDVHLAVVCNGNMGGMPERSPEERVVVREKEVRAAAEIIGCRLTLMDVGDDEMMQRYTSDYSRLEQDVREVIRSVDPHLLIVPHPQDYHQHHRAVCEVALNASANAGNPSIPGRYPPASRVPATLFMQPLPPTVFEPHVYSDISGTFERKIEALRCHSSQYIFLQGHHRTNLETLVTSACTLHGAACAVAYAEAFVLCNRLNRPTTIQQLAEFFPPRK